MDRSDPDWSDDMAEPELVPLPYQPPSEETARLLDFIENMHRKCLEVSVAPLVAQPAAFDAGTIATLRREAAERDHTLARYCETIDTHRALIEELTAERDELRALLPDADEVASEIESLTVQLAYWRDKAQALAVMCNRAPTPASDPETPRKSAAESPPVASGEKPNTGHPAGGRASTVHSAVWPAFPANALRGGDGVFRG
jgi:hypothetical protein